MVNEPTARRQGVPLLRARGLTFSHPISNGAHTAGGVFDVSLDLFPAEIVVVLGPSGGGKSSLIRLLAGRVVEEGAADQVLIAPRSEAARAFLAADGRDPRVTPRAAGGRADRTVRHPPRRDDPRQRHEHHLPDPQ